MAVDAQPTNTDVEADGDVIVTEGLTKVFEGRSGPLRAVVPKGLLQTSWRVFRSTAASVP